MFSYNSRLQNKIETVLTWYYLDWKGETEGELIPIEIDKMLVTDHFQ